MSDERFHQLQAWLSGEISYQRLSPLAGDASFRRYFRVHCGKESYVAMDALPIKENCRSFTAIAKTFYGLGLNVPIIYAEDTERGFLLMTDFGDTLYLDALTAENAGELYQRAFDELILIQSCKKIEGHALPQFDKSLYYQEMSLFHEWYLQKHLKVALSQTEFETLDRIYHLLINDALSQPQVCTHRDYHSRNLMLTPGSQRPGILDFQDAVWGPVTYDLLSLLRDCYIDWPPAQVEAWALSFQQQLIRAGLLEEKNPQQFLRWFDWIGLQRNLKCIGIFARLKERDNKTGYVQYIPRIIRYAMEVCNRYAEFADLKIFLQKHVEG